ncbi:MFS transporter [Capsulimonas corticalis]|uniref:MFS transporter n=1 Tax=Capsulimonas corticalis TaxID=2219043 RepID=A0A402CVA8_9BACT|nr:DHA2 family efflux MFS transporter permease subunit [Capsulimonas corticalis]BDI30339.1 MFS transporter [Capsulimonas corticalis]
MATQTIVKEVPELEVEPGGVLREEIPAPPSAPPPASSHHVTGDSLNPYRWFILAGLITAAILQVLDTTIVNVALPQMAGNLGATSEEIGWVVTGYILSNVIFLPMTAFLTQRFGRKRYLTASIILFTIASFFCGASHSLGEIVFWRILQGAGGAALLSTAQATLVQVFPKNEQGFVQSMFMMGLTVAPTLGPTLGGWITDNYTWNWCFLINVPIGIVATVLVVMFLHDAEAPSKSGSVDWLGIGLLATGLGAMQYVLEEGERNDWFQSNMIVSLSVLSIVCVAGLIFWQLSPRNHNPVVDFRVLKNPTLSACLFLFIVLGFGLYGGTYLFPLLAQTVLGFTSFQTGLALLPGGMATASAIVICGAILNRPKPLIDPRIIIVFGTFMTMLSMWMLGHISSQSGQSDTALALLIRGLGAGFLFIPINQMAFASLQKSELQQASGLLSLSRQLGGSFGIAALATFVQQHIQMHRVDLLGNYNDANQIFTQRLHALTGGFMSHGLGASEAHGAALSLLDRSLMRQAMTMSYADAFLTMLIISMITLPAVFLLRKNKAAAVHVEAVME